MMTKETVIYGADLVQRERHRPAPPAMCRAGRRNFFNLLLTFPYNLSSASCHNHGKMLHERVYNDPCHFAWQVEKISRLDSAAPKSLRPLSARPAGESDSTADNFQDAASSRCFSKAGESDSPATQGGRGLIGNRRRRLANESRSPAARGGRGLDAKRVVRPWKNGAREGLQRPLPPCVVRLRRKRDDFQRRVFVSCEPEEESKIHRAGCGNDDGQ